MASTQLTESIQAAQVAQTNGTRQYLSFKLADEVFAVNVKRVREVLDLPHITQVPRSPQYMRGVINVRGSVVPVVDMRMRFGLPPTPPTADTRMVVMEISENDETTLLGALADSVHEVMELGAENIEPPPRIGTRWRTDFIKGIGNRDDQFIIILDTERVFSSKELAAVSDNRSDPKSALPATEGETHQSQGQS